MVLKPVSLSCSGKLIGSRRSKVCEASPSDCSRFFTGAKESDHTAEPVRPRSQYYQHYATVSNM